MTGVTIGPLLNDRLTYLQNRKKELLGLLDYSQPLWLFLQNKEQLEKYHEQQPVNGYLQSITGLLKKEEAYLNQLLEQSGQRKKWLQKLIHINKDIAELKIEIAIEQDQEDDTI